MPLLSTEQEGVHGERAGDLYGGHTVILPHPILVYMEHPHSSDR